VDVVALRDRLVARHTVQPRTRVLASRVAAATVAVMCLFAVILLVLDAHTGLDLTDEGLYLLAADNSQPTAAANGWFGAYTGLMFAAVGHDIAMFRIAGLAILLACGALLGAGVRGVLRVEGVVLTTSASFAIVLGAAAGELGFYSLYLRTPGYNWLALTGATLAATGMLRQIAIRPREYPPSALLAGALVGLGCILALWGKASTGIGLAVLAFALAVVPIGVNQRERAHVGLVAAATAAVLLALHSLFIADLVTTVAVFQRSADWLAVVDANWYNPVAALWRAAGELVRTPWWVARLTVGLVVLAFGPLALMARRGRSSPLLTAVTAMAAIIAVGTVLLLQGRWVGGVDAFPELGLADVSVFVAALISALSAWFVARSKWNEKTPAAGRLLVAAALLMAAATTYAFGSNNGLVAQISGAGGLVLASAALCALVCVPRRWGARIMVGFSVAVAGVSLLLVVTARLNPYRMATPDTASTSIEFGQRHSRITVDPAAATFWMTLQSSAPRAGWRPGTKLLDLTWSPAVPYALGATVPVTLATGFNQETATASAIEALRLSGAQLWHDAWVLVSPDLPSSRPAEIVATAGRRFPEDYTLVLQLVAPARDLPIELWRPTTP